jgi:hypothetical protein
MVHFYNKNREVVMKLYDFSFDNKYEQVVNFSVDISYVFYKASQNIEDYKVYFESFLQELKMLCDNERTVAQFIPIERQIEIYLKQSDEFGHIEVSIKLNHFDIDYMIYESTLIINYGIDQSFLPELIEEISAVIEQ